MTDPDATKMLRAIINGQSALKQELLKEIDKARTDLKIEIKGLEKAIGNNRKAIEKNGDRIDKIGLQLAQLEDDAPTIDAFNNLEKRITKIELQLTKN